MPTLPNGPTLSDLEHAAREAREAQTGADDRMAERNALAAKLADSGVKYAALASAMGITVDGVTYVLRRVRRART